jgi:type IV secretory pathway TraG/TraD family ATPase VirD4
LGCKIKKFKDALWGNLVPKKPKENLLQIGKGFDLRDVHYKNFVDITMSETNRKGHLIGFGTTGAGKSRLIENMIEQDIVNFDSSVVIIDPKVDNGLLSRTYQAAIQSGNQKSFMLLSPIYPELSIKINPLSDYFMPEEAIGHIVSAIESTGDVFFYNVALEVSTAIVKSKLIIKHFNGDNTPLTFRDIYDHVGYDGLKELKDLLSFIVERDRPGLDEEAKGTLTLISNVLGSSPDYFSKVVSTLRTTLTQMNSGSIGKIFSKNRTNRFIEMLENDEKVILYVQTPSLLAKKVSDMTAKVTLSMIQTAIGRKAAADESFTHGLSIYIDEASNALYPGIENLFNKSRATNTKITAFSQNYADYIDAVGPEKAKMILGNANAKIFMRLVDPDTAEDAARYSGEMIKWDSMISTGSIMTRQNKDTILKAEDFLSLKPREFYYFGMEGNFKGKTTPIGDPELKIIMPKTEK